ncbi:MAG: esterase [Vicinamibacteria bacterium]|nr:esterase [Vicinamibacteria bacterium]
MRLIRLAGVVVALTAVASSYGAAQSPPAPAHVSPEVLSDRRVAFRVYAPKATDVTLRGDLMDTPAPLSLVKGTDGLWEGTTEALVPDFYSYSFTVDGVRTLDPRNALIKQGIASVDNMFFVPGPDAAFEDTTAVPHGDIRTVWYRSSTLGGQRRMHVYTPPGYDGSTDRYPVLYLLHGGGDDDSGWSTIGRAGFIVDNLLASGKVRPLIVVMPNGSLPRPTNLPPATPGTPPSPQAIAANAALQDRFTSELTTDIVPHIEGHFRVVARPDHRAIAGLSMGGGQTQRVLGKHPDAFAYVAVWSAGVNPATTADVETRNAALLGDAARVNGAVKVLSISVGDKDFALPGSKNLVDILQRHGITHTLHVSGGGHTWTNWRRYLRDYLQVVFR